MAPLPWLVLLENLAYQQLMKSPTFHRAVETVVKTVHRARYGIPPDELGGTKLDDPRSKFGQHFYDELRTQLGRVEQEEANSKTMQTTGVREVKAESSKQSQPAGEDAESAWQEIQARSGKQTDEPKQGFMGNYLEALRGQVNQKQPPP